MTGITDQEKSVSDAIFKSMKGKVQSDERCVTEAEVQSPADMFAGGQGQGCTFDKFNFADGKMDSVMTCTPPGQTGKMTMKINGDFSGKEFAMNTEMNMLGGPNAPKGATMMIKAKTSGTRIGECKDGEGAKS
jgi:hypothetical protein